MLPNTPDKGIGGGGENMAADTDEAGDAAFGLGCELALALALANTSDARLWIVRLLVPPFATLSCGADIATST